MDDNRKLWRAFLVAFLVYGIPYWLTPYAKLEGAMLSPALLIVALAAAVVLMQGAGTIKRATKVIGSSVVAVFAARIVVDCMADPTDHNLWPFEIIIGLLLGMPTALLGAWIGSLIARSRASGSREDG